MIRTDSILKALDIDTDRYPVLSVVGGDIYISVMTLISSVRQLVETPIHAMNEGTSPILSYNYAADDVERCKKILWNI